MVKNNKQIQTEELLTFSTLVSGVVLANVLYNFYKDNLAKVTKICQKYDDPMQCKLKYQIRYTEDLIRRLHNTKSKCKNARSEKRCIGAMEKRIDKAEKKLIKFKTRLKMYKKGK